jgi:PAS domain S-box-containing protein
MKDRSTLEPSGGSPEPAPEARSLRERLEAERARRRQSEKQLRMLETAVETMSTGVTITDMEGKILYVNPAAARMHGYGVEELMGEKARRFAALPASTGDSGSSETQELAPPAGGWQDPDEPWTRERVDATKDGLPFPVRLTSERLHDGDRDPIATVTICEDLRDRKRIHEALAGRDRILEALGLAAERFLSSDASWEAGIEEVLERLGRATGVDLIYIVLIKELEPFAPKRVFLSWETPGGSAEKTFSEGLGLPERVDLFARWEDRLREGHTLHGRVAELPADERQVMETTGVRSFVVVPIFVESTLRGYLSMEDGDPEREWSPAELRALDTVARTFSASIQRREGERALQASEEKYRDLLENASDLIQSVSPDGHFQYVNRAWRDTLGYTAEEVKTLMLWDVVRPEYPGTERDVVEQILTEDGRGRIEALFITKDGREITVEGSVNCRYVEGMPVATRGIFRDITERKRAERMIQDFISTVSHELRTPLTSIIASLGLLESGKLKDPERISELVSVAVRNSNRQLQLINNLLDLQKLAAGKMSFRIEPIAARPLLEEALVEIRAFAATKEIELELAEADPELELLGDRDRLLQVLNNLLSNAIKFSPDGERVTVSARAVEGGDVRLTVADRGTGVPEEFRHRLFERFTQLDSSSRRRVGGSGLGLSIVKGLAEGMNGSVHLDAEVERGATFHVDLPATPSS